MKFNEIISKIKSLVSEATIKESGESVIPADIREALLQGSVEGILSSISTALDDKNVQGFCNCSTVPERSDYNWSTLRKEGTMLATNQVVVSCSKCRKWWLANWAVDDQGNVTFSNVKQAAQVVVAMESERNAEEIQIDETAVTLREGLGMDENGIIKDACLIQPGWGSSGFYGADVLQREAASFSGLQMFIDHPTSIEETTLPERSVKSLAAVMTNTTFKEGWKGPGVYGDVKVFSDYQAPIKEKAPYIGLSLYGRGKAKIGEAEGKTGKIIESIPFKRSVDFVTVAGAGGALMPLLESAREPKPNAGNLETLTIEKLKEKRPDLVDSITVEIKESKDKEMIEVPIDEKELTALKESLTQKDTVITEQAKKIAKLETKELVREAAGVVKGLVEASKIPQAMKNRLYKDCVETPLTESGDLDTVKLTESVKTAIAEAEKEFVEIVGSGKVSGMGGGESTGIKESTQKEFDSMFGLEPVKE